MRLPWSRKPALEAAHARGFKAEESDKGRTVVTYKYGEDVIRLPHPVNMSRYDEWGKDAEARVALELLKNIMTGVGYYTEMPDAFQPETPDEKPHAHQIVVDDYAEDVNLDEKLQEINYRCLHKGFCPVEMFESNISPYDLRLLPSESFYKYVDKKGTVLQYTQERSLGDVVTKWETEEELQSILWFQFGYGDYGMSLLEPIGDLLDQRAQMNVDMPKAVHRWAYPIPIMETSGSKDALQQACEDRDVDEWIFVGNANKDDIRWNSLTVDPQARFIPYIELIYYQICEGLHAPLLLYLKNATEASATVMMESVDRLVTGVQRYFKRRVERYLFKPQTGDPVPRLVWGQPKTGLEDVTLADIASIINSPKVPNNQAQYILKQFFSSLPEPEYEQTIQPQTPMEKPPQDKELPVEAMVGKLNDLNTILDTVEQNHRAGKLKLTEACKLADRAITAHMKRLYTHGWERHRDAKFQEFLHKRLSVKETGTRVYTVSVPQP